MSKAPACGPAVLTPAIPPPVAAILGNLVHTLLDSRQLRSFCPLPSWLLAAAASDGHSALPGGLSAVGWFDPRRLPSALADSSMCGQAPAPPRRSPPLTLARRSGRIERSVHIRGAVEGVR